MIISSGSMSYATNAQVHSTQTRDVTQTTFEREPEVPLRPIESEHWVPFGARDNYSSPIMGNLTPGQHINLTV